MPDARGSEWSMSDWDNMNMNTSRSLYDQWVRLPRRHAEKFSDKWQYGWRKALEGFSGSKISLATDHRTQWCRWMTKWSWETQLMDHLTQTNERRYRNTEMKHEAVIHWNEPIGLFFHGPNEWNNSAPSLLFFLTLRTGLDIRLRYSVGLAHSP